MRKPANRLIASLVGVGMLFAGTACEPEAAPTTIKTDIDTFTVSNNPTSPRGNDTAVRLMTSDGKLKIAYLSFPVDARTTTVKGILSFTPKQSGFNVKVHNSGPFSNSTTHENRPGLGSVVGSLSQSKANVRQSISLSGVAVRNNRVYLALGIEGLYELEIVSREGDNSQAATFTITGSGGTPPTTTPPTPPDTSPPAPAGWKLSFSDEFNGSAVDTRKWNIYDEGSPWGSVESPKAATCPKASNVKVNGGALHMTMAKANGACSGGQAQTGAGMNTTGKFEQAQGRFEARVRLTHAGNNLWGGFWTHANGGPGYDKSMGSELDIFEYIGKTGEPNIKRYKPAIHFNYTCNPKCMQNVPVSPIDVTQWHTYSVEWGPTTPGDPMTTVIRFFMDGRQVAQFDRNGVWAFDPYGNKTKTSSEVWENPNAPFPAPFGPDRAHKIILSAWVGAPSTSAADIAKGFNPSGGKAEVQFDWVRVYKR